MSSCPDCGCELLTGGCSNWKCPSKGIVAAPHPAPALTAREMMSKAERVARERLMNNGRNPANKNAGVPTGSDLHLCEMILSELDAIRAAEDAARREGWEKGARATREDDKRFIGGFPAMQYFCECLETRPVPPYQEPRHA